MKNEQRYKEKINVEAEERMEGLRSSLNRVKIEKKTDWNGDKMSQNKQEIE